MNNPWNSISLEDYENHMKLDSVSQLQGLNTLMKHQFSAYPASTVMVLGVAGGNGLEYVNTEEIKILYGVDVNHNYLRECRNRYPELHQVLVTIQADLQDSDTFLPKSEVVIANLLIEYIGYQNFQHIIELVSPNYISCVIQVNPDAEFVSISPYDKAFESLKNVHYTIEEEVLCEALLKYGYRLILKEITELPNRKKLVRLDYSCSSETVLTG